MESITYAQMESLLDGMLIKAGIIVFSSLICWYFIKRISYKADR